MPRIVYGGDPNNGGEGPAAVFHRGVLFHRGVPVDAPDDVATALAGNSHFRVADPLDHDADGRRGGSLSHEATDELTALRARYQDVTGRKFYHGWGADDLRRRIADAEAG